MMKEGAGRVSSILPFQESSRAMLHVHKNIGLQDETSHASDYKYKYNLVQWYILVPEAWGHQTGLYFYL